MDYEDLYDEDIHEAIRREKYRHSDWPNFEPSYEIPDPEIIIEEVQNERDL